MTHRAAPRRRRPGLRAEVALAALGSLVAAVAMTWPAVLDAGRRRVPGDLGDPLLQAWQVAWSGHALRTDPGGLYDSNTFHPLERTFAFSDNLLGYAPAGLVGSGSDAAVARYDLLFVLAFALAALGAYLLARQVGASPLAASVAGAAFAFAPWRWSQVGHLHVLSTGGIALTAALLLRGHAGALSSRPPGDPDRPPDRPLAALAGWAAAAWQVSLGFGIGLVFGYLLALGVVAMAVLWWVRGAHRLPRALLVADLVGGLSFAGLTAALARPFLAVAADHPEARRTVGDLDLFSPPLRGLWTAPEASVLWGEVQAGARSTLDFPPEMALALGGTLVALAAVGLLGGSWSVRVRVVLGVGALALVVLALGTTPAGGRYTYLPLLHLPGWEGIRTPGRLVVPLTLLLAVLAAHGADRLRGLLRGAAGGAKAPSAALGMLLVALVLAEGLGRVEHPEVPRAPVSLASLPAPLYVVTANQVQDTAVMLWTTDGFPTVANGLSGFVPETLARTREAAAALPQPLAVDYFRDLGVATLVLPLADQPDPQGTAEALTAAGATVSVQGDVLVAVL